MVSEEALNVIFAEVGNGFGFDKVQAQFMAFKEFKVRWQRSYKWAEFKVSDYLSDAPEEVIRGLCRSIFSRIMGNEEGTYSKEMCDWVTSPGFAESKQSVYIRRSRNIIRSGKGEFKDLAPSYRRLIEAGLVEEDLNLCLSWSKEPTVRKVGNCSVLMKVITISKQLDTELIPDYVLDYCLYHELCHMLIGFDPTGNRHGVEFAVLEAKFPRRVEAEEWLKKMCLYL